MARETHEYPRNNQSQNSAAPGITEDYTAQVSEEIEGRVIKKLSREFSRTESRILGALSKLDEFLLNPQVRTFSGTTPGTFRNTDVENQESSGDRSQNDPHPEVEFSACRASNLADSDPDRTSHRVLYAILRNELGSCTVFNNRTGYLPKDSSGLISNVHICKNWSYYG